MLHPVQHAFGLDIPESAEEACRPGQVAVLVYDMQEGILQHVRDREGLVERVGEVLAAARESEIPIVYVRHVSVPVELTGVAGLRNAMSWQRAERVEDVRSPFPPHAPHSRIAAEVAPGPADAVFDKLGMSAFVGTPVDQVLRDRRITSFAVVGAVLEIGIEPTVRHGADLGYVPVLVEDACGVVDAEAAGRSVASLDYAKLSLRADTATVVRGMRGGR